MIVTGKDHRCQCRTPPSHARLAPLTPNPGMIRVPPRAELMAPLSGLVDPRQARGIRHPIGAVLTIMVLTKLAEATNVQECADRAGRDARTVAEAGQLPVPPRPVYHPRAETIRRLASTIDSPALPGERRCN